MGKKELSNQELNTKYDISIKRLKLKINMLGKALEKEDLKLRSLALNYKLNESNYDLLQEYTISLKKLKEEMIESWKRNIKRQ